MVTPQIYDNAPVMGGACSDTADRGFTEEFVGYDANDRPYYRIKTLVGGKCILARNWGPSANQAVLYPCLPYADQHWYKTPVSEWESWFLLINKNSGLCLVLQNSGIQAFVYTCGYADQIFYWD